MVTPQRRREERAYQYESRAYLQLLRRVAENVRKSRTALEWSQEEAAYQCDMAPRHFQQVEGSDTNWTAVTLARLAQGLKVDPAELLKPKKPKKKSKKPARKAVRKT